MDIKYRKIIYKIPVLYSLCKGIVRWNNAIFFHRLNKNGECEKKIEKYHNIAHGKTCFIVGNGPSLNVDDLELLKGRDCFASNYIHMIYSQTDWRPKYYCVFDKYVDIDFSDFTKEVIFTGPYFLRTHKCDKEVVCLNLQISKKGVEFSENVSDVIYDGYSVTFGLFQLATYMGYKKIILIGIDHNYTFCMDDEGKTYGKSSASEHFYGIKDKKKANATNVGRITKAYNVAKCYCDKHKIEVINATRGGKLEVFQRRSLEEVLENYGEKYEY